MKTEKNTDLSPEFMELLAAALARHGVETVGDLTEDQVWAVRREFHDRLAAQAVDAVDRSDIDVLVSVHKQAFDPVGFLLCAIVNAHDRGVDDAERWYAGDIDTSPRWDTGDTEAGDEQR